MAAAEGLSRSSATARVLARLGDCIPSPATVLVGSVLVGAASALSALLGLYLHEGFLIFSRDAVVLLYFCGAAAGFGPGLMLANLIAGDAGRPWRFIIGTTILFLSAHTATAAIFALQFRMFYAHWHASFPSIAWGHQLVFTSAGAVYQFTVDSLYVYYTLTPLIFLGLGLWFALRARA